MENIIITTVGIVIGGIIAFLIVFRKRSKKKFTLPDYPHPYPPVPPKPKKKTEVSQKQRKMKKLENTKVNQRRFYQLYFGQDIATFNLQPKVTYFLNSNLFPDYIQLRTPSQLTKDELMELLTFFDDRAKNLTDPEWHAYKYIERIFKNDNSLSSQERIYGIDWLRSKGILVPWMGLDEQDLLDYGWVKLKKRKSEIIFDEDQYEDYKDR